MHRKFIAIICATALTVTAVSMPAQARADDDIGKILAGLAALAIIGVAIDNHNDNDPVVVTRQQPRYVPPAYNVQPRVVQPKIVQPKIVQPRPAPRNVTKYNLPGQCLKTVRKGREDFQIVGRSCLNGNYKLTKSLPKACEVEIKGKQGKRAGYKPNCLRNHGYRLSVN